jgi:hypothetical protein
MNRRDMLKLVTSGVIGAMVLDPEKLLWVPGEKTIFLPPTVEPLVRATRYLWEMSVLVDKDGMVCLGPGQWIQVVPEVEWGEIARVKTLGGHVITYGSNEP